MLCFMCLTASSRLQNSQVWFPYLSPVVCALKDIKLYHTLFPHFSKRILKWKLLNRVWLFVTPYSPWKSPGKNTGVGTLSLLQGIYHPGIKPRSPTLQADSLPAEPQGKPMNTRVGSYPFSRESSWPRNWTEVSCIAGRFFTNWAIREAQKNINWTHYSMNFINEHR